MAIPYMRIKGSSLRPEKDIAQQIADEFLVRAVNDYKFFPARRRYWGSIINAVKDSIHYTIEHPSPWIAAFLAPENQQCPDFKDPFIDEVKTNFVDILRGMIGRLPEEIRKSRRRQVARKRQGI
jgi:hypothetical protein